MTDADGRRALPPLRGRGRARPAGVPGVRRARRPGLPPPARAGRCRWPSPPSWRCSWAAAAFLAVAALSDEADREVAAAPPRPKQAATKTASAKAEQAAEEGRAATAAGTIAKQGSLYRWPRTLEGFTVVINSTEDRASATTFARSAAKSKPAKLGVIRADDFKTLPQGLLRGVRGLLRGPRQGRPGHRAAEPQVPGRVHPGRRALASRCSTSGPRSTERGVPPASSASIVATADSASASTS